MPKEPKEYSDSACEKILACVIYLIVRESSKSGIEIPVFVFDTIKALDINRTIRLSGRYAFFTALCLREKLKAHWEDEIKSIFLPDQPDYRFTPQAKIHPFNLFCSIFYFRSCSLTKEISESEIQFFLKKAAHLGCFYAICLLQKETLLNLNDAKKNQNIDAEKITAQWDEIAKQQGTPGHMLAALAYFIFGQHFTRTGDEISYANNCYKTAYYHFRMAGFLMEKSTAAINNAFFGSDLTAEFTKIFNPTIDLFSKNTKEIGVFLLEHGADINDLESAIEKAISDSSEIKNELNDLSF